MSDCENLSNEEHTKDDRLKITNEYSHRSSLKVVELDSKESSIASSPIRTHISKKDKKKQAGPQRRLPKKLVPKRPQSTFGVLENRIDSQQNQIRRPVKKNLIYNIDRYGKPDQLKLLELEENYQIQRLEINHRREIQQQEFKHLIQQRKRAEELHHFHIELQKVKLEIKKECVKNLKIKIEDLSRQTTMGFELKNRELNLKQRQLDHEIFMSLCSQRLSAILNWRKEGMNLDEIKIYLKLAGLMD
ncbi:hypothetical protein O181_061816 [Austropuccinia psidii MF-1]|uniref:Uncharacterized protein n=1 Tax=Austropuccinia psidii MF-1 TaxID=1389203 RepID=A0A9Q3HXY0_9BASI|nr:hypothetical protein [Austropuccinia psidii MF-1]